MFGATLLRRTTSRVVTSQFVARSSSSISVSSSTFRAISSMSAPTSQQQQQQSSSSSSLFSAAAIVAGAATAAAVISASTDSVADAEAAGKLNPKDFTPLTLKKRTKYNHNTDVFVFDLPGGATAFPCASYIVVKYTGKDGKDVIRPYTPIDQGESGELHLVVKDYPQGNASRHFHELKVGDKLEMKGPLPKTPYVANAKKQIGMIAGGTGITPMLQIIHNIVQNPKDTTEVTLVFANTTSKDILLKEKLDEITKKHKNIKVTYLIDQPEAGWKGETGYVNQALLQKYMPKPSKDNYVYVCGPPGFMKAASGTKTPKYEQGELSGALKELGFDESNVFKL